MRLRYALVAAAMVTGSAAVAGPAVAGPAPVPGTAASAAAVAGVPVSRMLQPSDVGSGWQVSDEEVTGDWNLRSTLAYCRAARWSGIRPIASRGRALSGGTPSSFVLQEVREYTSAGRARTAFLEEVRNLGVCQEFPVFSRGNGEYLGTTRLTMIASGFAGDQSIVVRDQFIDADTGAVSELLRVFVRVQKLLTEITPSSVDPESAEMLGVRAATHL
jgi:hypothetical protein